ncbi:MAG: hypothetical protein NC090_02510 [Anaeroplasma bactoclasticum]|nr:hypothetical protein [Anaeroplasma bactoclasticum]
MKIKLRLFWIILLCIPLYLDVASCGPRPKYNVDIYTYENGAFVIQTTERLSRYQRINMKMYDIPEREGYTFIGWFEPSFRKHQDLYIDDYVDIYLDQQNDGKIRPGIEFTVYVNMSIYPILIQTDKLESYAEKISFEIEYCQPILPSGQNQWSVLDAKYGDKIADVLPSLEPVEGYTFVGYADIPITPEEYEITGIPEEHLISLEDEINYQWLIEHEINYRYIYLVYQKNK